METSIRFLRKQRNLTLAELSMRSGLTTAHLSMIERGKRQPSMQSIQKIADALQVDKEVFWWNSVTRPMSKEANYSLVHTRERVVYSGRYNDKLRYEDITVNPSWDKINKVNMSGIIGKLKPSCNTNPFAPTSHRGNELVYIISGDMICEIENEEVCMTTGDSLVIEAGMAHRFRNESERDVEVLMVRLMP